MSYAEVRKAFLSKQNVDHILSEIRREIGPIDKSEAAMVHTAMEKISNNRDFFCNKATLREVDNHVISSLSAKIRKFKMTDYREELTRRVLSESEPLNGYFKPKPINQPSILDLLHEPGEEGTSNNLSISNAPVNNNNSSQQTTSEQRIIVQNSGQTNISSMFGLNLEQLLIKSHNRFVSLTLDTRNRNLSFNQAQAANRDVVSWNYFIGTRFDQGTALSARTISNIIGIKCSSLFIPNFSPEQTNEFRQITMFIQEFADQSAIITSKTRAHFTFDVEYVGTRLKLTSPQGTENEIRFDQPVVTLSTLTLSFGSPFDKIILGWDRSTSVTVTNSIGAGQPTGFTTTNIHGLTNGDLVYLEGFSTGAPVTDNAVITLANHDAGHIISNTSTYYFEISGLDTSGVTGSSTVTTVIYGSRRFMIPLTFRCLAN